MAFTIVWSKQALEDLHGVVVFIARDNPEVAASFGYRLISKIDMLGSFPEMGRVVPEKKNEKIREIIVRPYRVIYEVKADQNIVAIARVWHAARGKPRIY